MTVMSSITLMFMKVLIDLSGGDCFGAKYEIPEYVLARSLTKISGQEKRFKYLQIRIYKRQRR
jgi:hypothetical protein